MALEVVDYPTGAAVKDEDGFIVAELEWSGRRAHITKSPDDGAEFDEAVELLTVAYDLEPEHLTITEED